MIQESEAQDLRTITLSWENFQLDLQEYQLACRFFEWERANEVRNRAIAHLEAHLDAYMSAYKRPWLNRTQES
jgi:hypothetical protein